MPESIEQLVSEFTEKLTVVVRRSALEQVLASLGGAAPATKRRGRPMGSKNKPAMGRRFKKSSRRSDKDMAGFSDKLYGYVKANPDQRGEQIAKALKTDVGTMRLPMKKLIAAKKIGTKGQRRGMTYRVR